MTMKMKRKIAVLATVLAAALILLFSFVIVLEVIEKEDTQDPEQVIVIEENESNTEAIAEEIQEETPETEPELIEEEIPEEPPEEVQEEEQQTEEKTEEVIEEIVDEIVQPPDQYLVDWNEDGFEDLVRIDIDGKYYVFPNYGTNEDPIYNESYLYEE